MLSTILSYIVWNPDPVAFSMGPLEVRWYGLIYATGFLFAVWLISKMFKSEGYPEEWADKVFIYLVIATIVGSRLGHVFFYDWAYYKDHLLEIFQVWKGGLASHGGAAAIILTTWLMAKYMCHKSFFWLADRIYVICAPVAALIRVGNLMNSEIYGDVTNLPWGFIFERRGETKPKHPTAIYEALSYNILGLGLLWAYWKKLDQLKRGTIFGIFLIVLFGMRFLIEFIKEPQVGFEESMVLNMGQWLSVPFILAGIVILIWSLKKGKPCRIVREAPAPKKAEPTHYAKPTGR